MESIFDPAEIQKLIEAATAWIQVNVLTTFSLLQVVAAAVLFAIARLISPRCKRGLEKWQPGVALARLKAVLTDCAFPLVALVFLWLAILVASYVQFPHHILKVVASLTTAWVVIRTASHLIREPGWRRTVAWVAWILAALSILNLLGPIVAALDSVSVSLGDVAITPLDVIKTTLSLAVLLWVALYTARLLEARITESPALSPSLKVLITKALKITLILLAVLVAIRSVGINLGALAIFSGAIGLGLGFGLQKIISNLVSGFILLMDKSIKPGDVIAVKDTYGWVNTLGGRYVSVVTRDGIEHLIPNETLIIEPVENWTYSNSQTRLKIPVGVHYNSDVHKVIELCKEAAAKQSRVLAHPAPVCLLKGFGDNSVDFEIRFWIGDPQNGVTNIKSEVLLEVWDRFKEHGIEIPYPQRDVHLRTPGVLGDRLPGAAPG